MDSKIKLPKHLLFDSPFQVDINDPIVITSILII
jgi:hypothetical protein